MTVKKMAYAILTIIILATLWIGWKLTSRDGYESAEYNVLEQDGNIELREYPDLMLATTEMSQLQGNDGSFGRLFGYISGGNKQKEKVSMTTPVFMEPETEQAGGQMGFVIPKKVTESGIPEPSDGQVVVAQRDGGKFAVIRFAGGTGLETRNEQQAKLEAWIENRGLKPLGSPEVAGYDPPWTPGFMRRNEILIRVEQ